MRSYILALGVGLLVGILYNLLSVRSPAPPVIALVGLLGILIGEQAIPLARSILQPKSQAVAVRTSCKDHVFGDLPANVRAAEDKA